MNKLRLRKFATGVALLGSALSGLIPATGLAQPAPSVTTPATTATADDSVKLEKFVVTGSLIPFAADAPAIPVTTITSVDIERSGTQTSLLEVLRKTVPQFVGNGNLGATNANVSSGSTSGGSQLSLFNAQTLVLVNGRRVAYAPVGASGGYQFVDVNLIPVSAVERIDVVTDGASAIYGTDAISGVVNIILKSDFQGAEVGGRYAFSDNKGNYAERSGHASIGASTGKTSVTISASWFKSDPLFNYERPYSNPTYGTGTFPGSISLNSNTYYFLNPSLNAPPMNTDLTPAQLVANGTYTG
ncbi:MAG: TonB-dependent receptor, partial [Verrucomicrobia bacterium]|nr:TonB-dependent receptor [Verrucomicrobiota bacterium]